jgi:hypothetical protein
MIIPSNSLDRIIFRDGRGQIFTGTLSGSRIVDDIKLIFIPPREMAIDVSKNYGCWIIPKNWYLPEGVCLGSSDMKIVRRKRLPGKSRKGLSTFLYSKKK